tara:strand:+ start:1371 stop:2708 length:1338 start_codon:yes stop_codon:yes gene_type:complete
MTSKIKVNTIETESGSTLTVGKSGDTVTLASGASQSGFGRTGTVDWQTGSIKTATFTAANGEGYFADTSSGSFNMNLPAGTAGNIVSVVDYTNTFQNNALTIVPNGSQKIGGTAANASLSTEGQSVTLVYVDDTEGWKNIQDSTSNVIGETFLTASGGSIATFGNFKVHTFTGPGTFTVCSVANTPSNNVIDYVVVGGGGGGGTGTSGGAGGGGAGGYRSFTCQPVTAQGYPVTVGGGGPGNPPGATPQPPGTDGSVSTFISNSSAGGGGGGSQAPGSPAPNYTGNDGGSGGGGAYPGGAGGSGNTPSVTPPQGNDGAAIGGCNGGGGGGAGAAAVQASGPTVTSPGGAGVDISPSYGPGVGASGFVAGGGGGGNYNACGSASGGSGGGGAGAAKTSGAAVGSNATVNTGGGGGGATSTGGPSQGPGMQGGNGGSGVVAIRYRFQ